MMYVQWMSRLVAPTLGVGALFCFQLACALPVISQSELGRNGLSERRDTGSEAGDTGSDLDDTGPQLKCVIEAEGQAMKVGQVPAITVAIKNEGQDPVTLVGSLDASDCRWRYPYCYFEIAGPEGYKPPSIGRCGNMNTLRKEDFVEVAPGRSFDPYRSIDGHGFFRSFQLSNGTFTMPGEYKITFVYSTKSENLEDWMGDPRPNRGEELADLWKEVPKLELRSNTISFVAE